MITLLLTCWALCWGIYECTPFLEMSCQSMPSEPARHKTGEFSKLLLSHFRCNDMSKHFLNHLCNSLLSFFSGCYKNEQSVLQLICLLNYFWLMMWKTIKTALVKRIVMSHTFKELIPLSIVYFLFIFLRI